MKTLLVLVGSLLMAALVSAQSPAAPGGAAGAKASTATKAAPDKKGQKAPEPKIAGVAVPRGENGFMGVEIVDGSFKISFYDAKKAPKAPDVLRAVLRWDPKYKVGQERVVLNPTADGKALSAPKAIRPPYNFKLFITLIKQAGEAEETAAAETHVIDFRA